MWTKLIISVVVMPGIILASCATTPPYEAKAINRSDGAIVRGWESAGFMHFTFMTTEIEKVDGQKLPFWSQVGYEGGWGWMVDPGLRVLSVAGTYGGGIGGIERYTGRVELKATLKAGHSYRIKAERSGELMTLWVEDEAMNDVVSEKQSTKTVHWIKWV